MHGAESSLRSRPYAGVMSKKYNMNKIIKHSLTLGFIFSFSIITIALMESSKRNSPSASDILMVFFIFFASSTFTAFLSLIAYKYHSTMKHKGWQRILIISCVLLSPASIYIGYEIEYVNHAIEHILLVSIACTSTYIIVIGLFFLITFLFNWVKSGFTDNTHNNSL